MTTVRPIPSAPAISTPASTKGQAWSEEEHRQFLLGLERYGKGEWRCISRNFVKSRSPSQVASHAQKYFKRLLSNKSNPGHLSRKRRSIHDMPRPSEDPAYWASLAYRGASGAPAQPHHVHQPQPHHQSFGNASMEMNGSRFHTFATAPPPPVVGATPLYQRRPPQIITEPPTNSSDTDSKRSPGASPTAEGVQLLPPASSLIFMVHEPSQYSRPPWTGGSGFVPFGTAANPVARHLNVSTVGNPAGNPNSNTISSNVQSVSNPGTTDNSAKKRKPVDDVADNPPVKRVAPATAPSAPAALDPSHEAAFLLASLSRAS